MAFTKAPEQQTYSTERIPGCYGVELRDYSTLYENNIGLLGSPDPGMVNLLPRTYKIGTDTEIVISVTRPPLKGGRIVDAVTHANADARGVYIWEKTSSLIYYFAVCGTKVYTSTNGSTWTAVTTLSTNATTPVGFTEFIDATNVKKLVLVDGVEGYVFTSDAAGTKITDADFPTPHLPFPVFLDGYLFLAKTDTGDIYNSNLNDPALWTAGDFISSELYPDDLKAIAKINNYLLAIGTQGSEYFYDASNATGTPLARMEGASLPFGTYFPYSIATNKNSLVLVANNNDGEPTIKIIENLKYSDIDTAIMAPVINNFISTSLTTADFIWGGFMRIGGDLLYFLNLSANRGPSGTDTGLIKVPFFAYSTKHKMWVEFRAGTSIRRFPVTRTTFSGKTAAATYVQGWDGVNGVPFFGTCTFGTGVTPAEVQDEVTNTNFNSSVITIEIRTPAFDFGTMNLKTHSRLGIHIQFGKSATTQHSGTIDWINSDYSYGIADVGTRTIDMTLTNRSTNGNAFPFITQLGQFRSRSFRFTYSGREAVQIFGFELDINKGQQ